ncbi:transcription factor MYC2-like [Gastrolobium bilobum]|uniref:transcription factor MYC2-like n=1 Tax=Gastrolobium bilobum TaxID=150636 RepID=UPI002AB02F7F|nr:transcription factor MYC2-like [Gastrolobium bilobum]
MREYGLPQKMREDNTLSLTLSLQLMHGSHLKALIEDTTDTQTWTYAILWRSSSSNRPLLNFHDGHYNPKASSSKQLRIFGSSVTVTVSDEEWFFKISMSQSFADTEDLPGHAFFNSSPVWLTGADQLLASTWQRTKRAHHFGIRTLVAIPSENGVLELGSTELILCNTARLNTLFDFLVRTRLLGHLPLHRLREQIRVQSKSVESWLERTNNEIENCGHDSSYKPLRGKEKISDLKWSWPLLTYSSDKSTDKTSYSCSYDYSGSSRISYSVHNM